MLLKLMILEALVAASSVRASETTPSPVMDAKSRHTPLAACPGRSKVYEALRSYSAPASFCSSFLSLTSGTSTATAPSTSVPVVGGSADPTVTSTMTVSSTVIVSSTTTTSMAPQCTASAPVRRRNVVVSTNEDIPVPAKYHVPPPLNQFAKSALSSGCHCMYAPTSTAANGAVVTARAEMGMQPTVTVISNTTVTTTVTSTQLTIETANAIFFIKADTSNSTYDGAYLTIPGSTTSVGQDPSGFATGNDVPNTSPAGAAFFQIDMNGQLTELESGNTALLANQDNGTPCEFVYYNDASYVASAGAVALNCCVDDKNELDCGNSNNATAFSFGPEGGLYFCTSQAQMFAGLAPVSLQLQVVQ